MDGVSHHARKGTLVLPVLFTFAYLAVLCLFLMVVSVYEISLRFVLYRGLRKLAEKCTRQEKIPLVLKDGDTIVAVGKTTKGLAFYIRNNQAQ
jgi:hypothetical protein